MKIRIQLVILILLFLFSCKSYKAKIEVSKFVNPYGMVEAINYTKGYFVVYWECANPPFKKQPCWAKSDHLIKDFYNVQVGDTLSLTLNFK